VRNDKSASERPPQRPDELRAAGEDRAREAAHGEVEGLKEPVEFEVGSVRGESAAAERRSEAATAESTRSVDSRVPTNGRSAVLTPVDGTPATSVETPEVDEPLPLGPSAFNPDGSWAGPVLDLLSGDPGEDHDPLPPGEKDDLL
jgi:hypothetical protein